MNGWMIFLTAIIAVAGIVQAGTVWFQWQAMVRQNQNMIDNTWLENRPWLIVRKPRLEALIADKPLNVSIAIKNAGRTPAYIKKSAFTVGTTSALGIEGLELPQKQIAEFPLNVVANTIPPGETLKGPLNKQHTLTPRELKQIQDGLLLLTLYAEIVYSDGQGKVHLTRTILAYSIDYKRFVGRGNHCYMD